MVHELTPPAFIYKSPEPVETPFVFAVPHSGRHYPEAFVNSSLLGMHDLRRSEDAYVDELFETVASKHASLLIATHARAYLDLNRSDNELDPKMFTPELDEEALNITYRVQAGLGVIPQYVAENTPIYDKPLPAREAYKRLEAIHRPYHTKLRELLTARAEKFGIAFLIDCHSMPSETNGSQRQRKAGSEPDIVLGDCWGNACSRDLTSIAETLFLEAGFNVRRNVPYSGGYSTNHYGKPKNNIHALQIEISRALYMNEENFERLPNFSSVQRRIGDVSKKLVTEMMKLTGSSGSLAKAAE